VSQKEKSMKRSITFAILGLGILFFAGCNAQKANEPKPEFKTSKQVEKELNWRYCEESK
jgi:hypothetical protein